MRSNSGDDQARNNLHDPTLRDRTTDGGKDEGGGKEPKAPADHRQGRKD